MLGGTPTHGSSSSGGNREPSERNWIYIFVRVVLTFIVFSISYQSGSTSKQQELQHKLSIKCPEAVPAPPVIAYNTDTGPGAGAYFDEPCEEEEAEEEEKEEKEEGQGQGHGHGHMHSQRQRKGMRQLNSVCSPAAAAVSSNAIEKLNSLHTYLHAWKGDAAAEVFNWLHNPASPAKFSYIMSDSADWNANTKYTEIEVSKVELEAEFQAGRYIDRCHA